jgi:hypothetical protein
VEAPRGAQLTGTNRSIGLILIRGQTTEDRGQKNFLRLFSQDFRPKLSIEERMTETGFLSSVIRLLSSVLLTWWLLRGICTRSHPELGRESPQR